MKKASTNDINKESLKSVTICHDEQVLFHDDEQLAIFNRGESFERKDVLNMTVNKGILALTPRDDEIEDEGVYINQKKINHNYETKG